MIFVLQTASVLLVTMALLVLPDLANAQPVSEPHDTPVMPAGGSTISSLSLSPDGRYAAGIAIGLQATAAILIDTYNAGTRILARPERDSRYRFGQVPIAVHWVANDLVVVDYNNREAVSMDLSGRPVAKLGERFIRRLQVDGPLAETVLVYRDLDDGEVDLVNARTGSRQRFRIDLPGKPSSWVFDDSGELRAVTMVDSSRWSSQQKVSNWYRGSTKEAWQLLQEWPIANLQDAWVPIAVLPEADTLAVLSRHGRDNWAVFKYDSKTRQHRELMAAHAHDDILHADGLAEEDVERVVTGGLRPTTVWFDPRWAQLQSSVDVALPGRTNNLAGDKNGRVLIESSGDVDPGRWFVLDTKNSTLREIAVAKPGVDVARMRPMQAVRYDARDGLSIPAYLTRPAGSEDQPAPTVVLIHGGPNVRDRWVWNLEVQMLAKAGYVVFQPQFRGSTGFGRRFEEAGYLQWGRAMQDDITDGVKFLINEKIADPSRVCIYGSSYGGYAAMWGAIKTPELYRCAISFAGVSDLVGMLSGSLLDDATPVSRAVALRRVGDPVRDKAALDEVSPLKHAERVRIPILIAHGEDDRRVLPSQSKAMVQALERAAKPVVWLPLEGEGHGLTSIKSQMQYYAAVLGFLERHISPSAAATRPTEIHAPAK